MKKIHSRSKALLLLTPLVACLSMAFAQQAAAHGYLMDGRAHLCKSGGGNTNCGSVQYEPQSVEGPDGFPSSGPKDGTIAAAGNGSWNALNEQTADRWKRTTIKTGQNTFKWFHTANHVTKDYKFYITKQGWNPNQPLTRAAFDTQPFCSMDYGMKQPPQTLSMQCNVPSDRSGYHVILSVWDVGDTSASFYNVMDANIVDGDGNGNGDNGSTPPPAGTPTWKDVGDIFPDRDLKAGDKVKTRVFKASGEINSLSTSITIASDAAGTKDSWPLQLAKAINSKQTTMMAGVLGVNGSIEPVAGKNDVFAKDGSGITRVEIQVDAKQPPVDNSNDFSVTPKSDYSIENGKAKVDFFVTVGEESAINAKLFNKQNEMVGFTPALIERSGTVSIDASPAVAGPHTLVVTATPKGGKLEQKSFEIKLSGGQSGGSDDSAQCQQAYNAKTAYSGGAKVQHKGKIYSARWWIQNSEPGNAANTGPDTSGKVWKDEGAAACK